MLEVKISTSARLRQAARSDSALLVSTTIGTMVVRLASTIILTRLLAPDVFGTVAIITSIFFVVGMLTDLGFQAFIVRHPSGDDPRFLDVIWTIHLVRGIGLTLMTVILSPIAGIVLDKPGIVLPLAAASLTMALTGATSLSLSTTLRHGGARKLCVLDLVLAAFQTAVGVVLALVFRNVWAIIAAMIAQSLARLVLSYTLFPHSVRRWRRDAEWTREFWRFSRIIMVSSSFTLLISQSDKLFLARIFTLGDFGLYAIAASLAALPTAFVGAYASRLLYPAYARTWQFDRAQLRHVYYGARRAMSLLYAFGSGGLIGAAPLLVALLYDPRYAGAAPYLALLGIAGALTLSTRASAEMLTAAGWVDGTLKGNIVRVAWLAVCGPLGYGLWGVIGVIAAFGTVEVPALLYGWYRLHRLDALDLKEELGHLAVIGAGIAAGALVSHLAVAAFPDL